MSFKIFVVQHSHIDIGYTERQEKITDYQMQFIKQAVDFATSCKQEERDYNNYFKFTCEGFWAVEQYLKKYGSKGEEKLIEGVKKGYLELSAFYLHNTELLDEGHIHESIQRAASFCKENELPLNVGMASDINGFSWGMADALADRGIKYLITNLNSHHGGAPLGKPLIPFYWKSPKGKKILVWNGLAYHKANLLGLIPGFCPTSDPGIPGMMVSDEDGFTNVRNLELAEKRVFQMVEALKSQGYEYDFLPVMGGGLYTDNNPVTEEYCELIKEWNEKYGEQIHIQTATLEEFFNYFIEHAGEIPTYVGDWSDWWTDGVISSPFEVKLFRNAQRTKRLVEMLDPKHEYISKEQLRKISDKLFLFAEHTWGHSASYSDPWKLMVKQLFARKAKHAIEADELASKALDEILKVYGEGDFRCNRPFEYRVINPLNTVKKYIALIPIDFWEVTEFEKGCRVIDLRGRTYKYQTTNTLRGRMIAIEIELGPKEAIDLKLESVRTDEEKVDSITKSKNEGVFENNWYKATWTDNGLCSLVSKESGNELLNNEKGLCEPVYQIFPNADRTDAAGFGYSKREKPEDIKITGKLKAMNIIEESAIFTRLKAEYEVQGATCYRVIYSFYSGLPQIEVNIEMTKDIVMDPEGMYAAFPFNISKGKWYIDKPGALILPGKDQLPGTCCDYYCISNGAVLAGEGEGIGITMLDTPMVTIGEIKLWDYTTTIDPTGTMYSWLCNNKWETNFKVECGGLYEFRYILEFSNNFCDPNIALEKVIENNFNVIVVRK